MIRTSAGNIFHSGDWKLDDQPLVGHGYSKSTFTDLAEEGVAAMVCDSTNATLEGHSMSEATLYNGLLEAIRPAKGRVIVACFGSNIARLHTLAAVARASGRYMGLMGRSLLNMSSAAKAAGLPIHASGHPAREELRAMYQWVRPAAADCPDRSAGLAKAGTGSGRLGPGAFVPGTFASRTGVSCPSRLCGDVAAGVILRPVFPIPAGV